MKKIFALAIILLIFAQLGSAKKLISHDISIEVKESNAAVTERYLLGLNVTEANEFDNISKTSASELKAWQEFYDKIKVSLKSYDNLMISSTKIGGGQFGYEVKLEYLVENFSPIIEEQGRYETRKIIGKEFVFYDNDTGILVIPVETYLNIKLLDTTPENIVKLSPTPWISDGTSFKWIGGTYTSDFEIIYKTEKAVSESFGLEQTIKQIITDPIYAGIIIIILVLAMIYRKQLVKIIVESFTEEEIELPKKEL